MDTMFKYHILGILTKETWVFAHVGIFSEIPKCMEGFTAVVLAEGKDEYWEEDAVAVLWNSNLWLHEVMSMTQNNRDLVTYESNKPLPASLGSTIPYKRKR